MTGTDLTNYDAQWAAEATKYAASEPISGGTFLSTRGGVLTYGEQAMPGNQAAVIILDSYRENSFYGAKYDSDNAMPPVCYAFGRDADQMGPHISMASRPDYFKPQSNECQGCPMNEWGSADTGRGKACQNRRRLTMLPAGFYTPRRGSRDFDLELFDDPHHFQTAELAFVRTPVTSVTEWAKYVQLLASSVRRPPYGVVTRIYLEPDPKTQYKLHFELIDVIPDTMAQIIIDRHNAAEAMPFQGHQAPDGENNLGGFRRPGA